MRKIESYAVTSSLSRFIHDRSLGITRGWLHTPVGTVAIEQYPDKTDGAWMYLGMSYRGRVYYRDRPRKKPATDRGLAIIAGRFAAEVAAMAGRKHAD